MHLTCHHTQIANLHKLPYYAKTLYFLEENKNFKYFLSQFSSRFFFLSIEEKKRALFILPLKTVHV